MSQARPTQPERTPALPAPNARWTLEKVAEALRGLQFGSVTLLVQDGVVVQVERTERRRYRRPGAENGS